MSCRLFISTEFNWSTDHARLVVNAMGSLNETCAELRGSMIEIKSIAIHS